MLDRTLRQLSRGKLKSLFVARNLPLFLLFRVLLMSASAPLVVSGKASSSSLSASSYNYFPALHRWRRKLNRVKIPSDDRKTLPCNQSDCSPSARERFDDTLLSVRSKVTSLRFEVERRKRSLRLALYWLTSLDSMLAVVLNDYRTPLTDTFAGRSSTSGAGTGASSGDNFLGGIYSRVFYFARLRPRLLFSVGALLRALQLCTPLQTIIDPSAGVGVGVNICARLAGSRWVQPVVVGWACTRHFWEVLGAERVEGAHLPITVSIKEELERRRVSTADAKRLRGGRSSYCYRNENENNPTSKE